MVARVRPFGSLTAAHVGTVPVEIQYWGDVQVVGGPADKGFSGSEHRSEVEGLRAELDEGSSGSALIL